MADIPGVDVSSYQGAPHNGWAGDSAFEWAAVKMTELNDSGLYQNPDAGADWDYLKASGKGRVAYLYGHANTDPGGTVKALEEMLGRLGLEDGDGIAVDLETLDGREPAEVASWARVVTGLLRSLYGRTVILYTNVSTAESGACAGLGGCFLWIADPDSPAGCPRVPAPWKDWVIHQHSITAPLDKDVAHFSTLAAMRAAIGKPAWETVTAVHVATGTESLEALSKLTGCLVSTMLRLTAEAAPNGEFSAALAAYINAADFAKPLPKGARITFYERIRK